MKASDLHGKALSGGQYDWGENTNAKRWDAAEQDLDLHLRLGLDQYSIRPERQRARCNRDNGQRPQLRPHLPRRLHLSARAAFPHAPRRLRQPHVPAACLQHHGPQRHARRLRPRRGCRGLARREQAALHRLSPGRQRHRIHRPAQRNYARRPRRLSAP